MRLGVGFASLAFAMLGVVGLSGCSTLAQTPEVEMPRTNVAALAQFSFVAFLLGPPLLGYVAQAFGIRWTFGVGLPLVALSFAAAAALRR